MYASKPGLKNNVWLKLGYQAEIHLPVPVLAFVFFMYSALINTSQKPAPSVSLGLYLHYIDLKYFISQVVVSYQQMQNDY